MKVQIHAIGDVMHKEMTAKEALGCLGCLADYGLDNIQSQITSGTATAEQLEKMTASRNEAVQILMAALSPVSEQPKLSLVKP